MMCGNCGSESYIVIPVILDDEPRKLCVGCFIAISKITNPEYHWWHLNDERDK